MFALIDLIYSLDSLLPAISAETIGFHHGKHLAGYVANLNKAIVGTELESASLEEIVKVAEPGSGVFNNAGQILNHNLYFSQFKPSGNPVGARPEGLLEAAIDRDFGSFEAFKEAFVAAGISIFGSGWVWLQADSAGVLSIGKYSGADNPVTHGLRPLLTFDVWEHAYYLDYQNRRADHLAALWGIVDWEVVGSRYLEK
jgi:Fe-Mn family superoxide dismutase